MSNQENDKNNPDSKNTPKYRLLGVSGLVEDEEGNIYSASEIDTDEEPNTLKKATKLSSSFTNSSFVSSLDDKSNPAYWYFYYDPRYCGPSREAYMEKMARQYGYHGSWENKEEMISPVNAKPLADKSSSEPHSARKKTEPTAEKTSSQPLSAREKADLHQREAEREGLCPDYHDYSNSIRSCRLVNRRNEVIIAFDEYSNIGYFHNGLARVQKRKTGKFGFVDIYGKEVIPCIWKSAGEFSEYMAGVQDDDKKCGYIDVTGRLAIPCVWDEGWPFKEGFARVQQYGNIGLIDKRGKNVVPCVWKGMGDFSEGLAGVQDAEGKCGFVNRAGKIVIPCRWKNVWTFSEGLAVVQDFNKLLGFIDKNGVLVIPCRWKKVNFFKNGLAKVSDSKTFFFKDKWVYIDKQGRVVK